MREGETSAFPYDGGRDNKGMTLRDYFAAKAMRAVLPIMHSECINAVNAEHVAERTAELSYQLADAMMKARKAFVERIAADIINGTGSDEPPSGIMDFKLPRPPDVGPRKDVIDGAKGGDTNFFRTSAHE